MLELKRYNSIGLLDPSGAWVKFEDTAFGLREVVCLMTMRYRKAQAWHDHLCNCEEDRDEDAITNAATEVTVAQTELDVALAHLGDDYAARRLNREPQIGGAA